MIRWNEMLGRPASYGAVATERGQRFTVRRVDKYVRKFALWRDGQFMGNFPSLAEGKAFAEKLIEVRHAKAK